MTVAICQLTDSGDPGGAESVILSLVAALREAGADQRVVTMNEGWLSGELRSRGWPVTVLQSGGSVDVRWIASFRRFLKSESIGLVHTHLIDAGFYGSLGARAAGVPCVVTEHGDVAMAAKRGARSWIKLATAQCLARRVVAVSDGTARALVSRLRFGRRKVSVIPNGIDARALASGPPGPEARLALGIPATARVVGTLGALTAVKDHETLLRAHALVPGDVWCVIAGDGPRREELSALAARLGTAGRVVLPGFVREIPSVLAALDVFALSSASEGLPLALLEAIAAGRPVVCTAVGGIPEVMARAGGGRLVPAADPRALASGLRDALEGRVDRSELPPEFRRERMAQDYLALYRDILGA